LIRFDSPPKDSSPLYPRPGEGPLTAGESAVGELAAGQVVGGSADHDGPEYAGPGRIFQPEQRVRKAEIEGLLARAQRRDETQDYPSVICLCTEVLHLETGPSLGRASALNLLAKAHYFLGNYDEAVSLTKQEAALRAELGDREGHAKSLNNLGLIALSIGEHHVALEHLLACFDSVAHSGLPMHDVASACLVNIGNLYHELRDNQKAVQYFRLGIEASVNAGNVASEIAGLSGLGMALKDEGRLGAALQEFLHALQLASDHARQHDEAELLDNLGQVYLAQGQHDLARRMYQDAATLARSLAAVPSEVNALINLGRLEVQLRQAHLAADHLSAAMVLTTGEAGYSKTALVVSELLAEATLQMGDGAGAAVHLQETLRLERLVKFEEHQQKIQDLSQQLEIERTTHQAEAYRLLNVAAQEARQQAEEEVRQRTLELEVAHREVITRLGVAAEYRDDKTGSHTQRVSQLAAQLAQNLGTPAEEVELIRLAASLHDIGKIGVPDAVLLKTGKLGPEEHEIMKHHTTIGARVLQGSTTKLLQMAEAIAQHHHEKWDGSGYPNGLAARIVALADVWDALTTERPYKVAWTAEQARAEIEVQIGRHFDPELAEVFLQTVGAADVGAFTPADGHEVGFLVSQSGQRERPELRGHVTAHIGNLNQEAWDTRQTSPEASAAQAQDALMLSEQHDHTIGLIASLRTLAFHDLRTTDYRAALDHLRRASLLADDVSSRSLQRDCKNLLAWAYKDLHDSDKATRHLLDSLELSRQLQDESGQANALANLGVIASSRMNDRAGALVYFEQALALQRRTGNLAGQANCLYNMADNLVELGEFARALDLGREAVKTTHEAGNVVLEALSVSVLARAQAGNAELVTALEGHDRALRLMNESGVDAPDARAWLEMFRAICLRQLEHHEQAVQVLDSVRTQASGLDLKELLGRVHHELAQVHKQQGNLDAAMQHLEQEREVERALNEQQTAERTQALMMQYEVERAQTEADLYRLRTIELANANVALEKADREKSVLLATLQEQAELLERQVREDALSGLYNRRHIEHLLEEAFEQHEQGVKSLAVAMIDIDHFKRVNDSFSHPVGDEVIRRVARLLRELSRETDAVGRYGGEEFLLLLPETTLEQAANIIERLRRAVEIYPWSQVAPGLRVTLSVGAAVNANVPNYEKLVAAADAKLYQAKRNRNTSAV